MNHSRSFTIFKLGLVSLTFVINTFIFAQPGSADPNFNNAGSGFDQLVFTTSIQSDQKIVIGGNFSSYNGVSSANIARTNSDGSLDATFNVGTGFNNYVRNSTIQVDGKIVLGGDFTTYNGGTTNRIARLNTDGTLDASFIQGTGFNNVVNVVKLQSDGKMVVGGNFTTYNGTIINRLARLNSDGSLDATFNIGAGFNNRVNTISIQSDGKIVLGGDFVSFNGTSVYYAVRLDANGSIDPTFAMGNGFDDVIYSSAIQLDGKILFGGLFSGYNNSSSNGIARINTDGSIDATFDVGSGINNTVTCLALQNDGKVLAGGFFDQVNGTSRNRMARLNSDGSLDAGYISGSGFNDELYAISIQADGKHIAGGFFTSFNGISRNRIVRLLDCYPTTSSLTETACVSYDLNGTLYTASGIYTQTVYNVLGCDSTITLNLTLIPVDVSVTNTSPTLTAIASGATYQWLDCSNNFGLINGATNQSFEATANGSYAVVVTQNGCADTSVCEIVGNVGLIESTFEGEMELFPNPTDGKFTVELGNEFQEAILIVRNSIGQEIQRRIVQNSTLIDVEIVAPAGIYLVEVNGNGVFHALFKVVKK